MRSSWIGLAAGLVWIASARADSEAPIALAKVPAVVVESARQAAPGVKLEKAVKSVEEGKTYYDLIGRDAQGREIDVELTASGQVLGVGTEVPMASVPKIVLSALKTKSKGMRFTEAEIVTLNGRLIAYRLSGRNSQGDDVEATVSPDGRAVEIDVDND